MLANLLRCDHCGTPLRGEIACSGCGALRAPGVPLDECEPDGTWVVAAQGPAALALATLRRLAGSSPLAARRLAVARRILEAFPPGGEVEIRLDLRQGDVGEVVRRRRRGNSQEVFSRLGWLWVAGPRLEARVIQTVHRKVTRTFRGGVEAKATRSQLDELRLQTPSGGLRLPFRQPSRLAGLGPESLEDSVPGLSEGLPRTAPGLGIEPVRDAGLALAFALLLLLGGPLLAWGSLPPASALTGSSAELRVPLTALESEDPHQRRAAVSGLAPLAPWSRWRALRVAGTDPLPAVRDPALEELGRSGALGVATLAERCGPGAPLAARVEAFAILRRAAPWRARQIALSNLQGPGPGPLRLAWTLGLAELAAPGDALAQERLAELVLSAEPALAAAAAPGLAGERRAALLPAAIRRARAAGDERALISLARALGPGESGRELLRELAQDAGLSARARRRLEALAE